MTDWSVVRCSGGAYYETKWFVWGSFKAIRLGPKRIQRCPVHHKFEMTERVRKDELTSEIQQEASQHRDSGII
ncbi:hypothetical protein [Flexivirga caeni]|uniref:Uncharacterized protein n=1 Tax=Flexivirga caeni TaxID=2294115 RepID=A0A3M9MBZ8_9MICO|nr:hypothetical protein [Flexivirga caeni]RNI23044.1 hypothetical protein EFY87_07795 [Flexivirga caeni]